MPDPPRHSTDAVRNDADAVKNRSQGPGCGHRLFGAFIGALSATAMALSMPILILLAVVDFSEALTISFWMVGCGAVVGAVAPEQTLFLLAESVQGLLRFIGSISRGFAKLFELFQ